MIAPILLSVMLGQTAPKPGVAVKQDGAARGQASTLNCSTGTSCTVAGNIVTLTATGGAGLEGVWIGPTPPSDPVTYEAWLANGHVGHWGWIDTSTAE